MLSVFIDGIILTHFYDKQKNQPSEKIRILAEKEYIASPPNQTVSFVTKISKISSLSKRF